MDLKILLASFGLVFLAELGDKTQLTALAFSASSRSPWSVFIGTSLALVAASAIAVVAGAALARVVPERILHIVSAVMFIAVGVILLVNQARSAAAAKPEPAGVVPTSALPASVQQHGLLTTFILRQALRFEEDLTQALRDQAAQAANPALRDGLLAMATEDEAHAKALAALCGGPQPAAADVAPAAPDLDGATRDMLAALQPAAPAADPIRDSIRRQEAAAAFYVALARIAPLHGARDTLRWLAMEELRHAQRLCALVNHEPDKGAAAKAS
jgi:rubrerythrin